MTENENFKNLKHLYNRAGFGLHYSELQKLCRTKLNKVVSDMIEKAKVDMPLTTIAPDHIKSVMLKNAGLTKKEGLSPEQLKERQKLLVSLNKQLKNLNTEWVFRMMDTDSPLREKMTLFWNNHFACREEGNPYFAQVLNNIQRKNALGDFKILLIEVSKSASMLNFLNNQQNKKGRPNENFARELMELFTLGRGNYSETDIKESARAFTGWAHDAAGNFEFNPKNHDNGIKTFFGKEGNFNGEDIIDMILQKPEAAVFIARKAYRFFVNDVPDENHVQELGNHFYKSKYDIAAMMNKMFTSDWFYAPENMGNKIKSPVEFIVSLSRQFNVTYKRQEIILQLQRGLGQTLFYPPNVAGWAGGRNWIDSSSLMLRLTIPSQILNDSSLNFSAKTDPDDENIVAMKHQDDVVVEAKKKASGIEINWDNFWSDFPKDYSVQQIAAFVLQCKPSTQLNQIINSSVDKKNAIIKTVSSPEYQLC